ncbi:MAG: hypothetical protein ACFFB0_00480 [Promethearchaeota archaeon]
MMCSIFSLGKTVQDITREILNILDQYDFPDFPFVIKGYENLLLSEVNHLKSDILSLKNLIELWYGNRIMEKWEMKDTKQSLQILHNLNSVKLEDISLCSILEEKIIDSKDYERMMISYILKLNKIKTSLSNWMWYLFIHDS